MLRRLLLLAQTLEQLPGPSLIDSDQLSLTLGLDDRFLRIKLSYTEETPEDYHPPHFRASRTFGHPLHAPLAVPMS